MAYVPIFVSIVVVKAASRPTCSNVQVGDVLCGECRSIKPENTTADVPSEVSCKKGSELKSQRMWTLITSSVTSPSTLNAKVPNTCTLSDL